MSNYPSVKPGGRSPSRVVAGLLFLSWLFLGNGSLGLASETRSQLKIEGDSITGALIQVPLHSVLEELNEKLGIEFEVPKQELDKLVSANLNGESVSKSLSKILSSWDHAFQVNGQGRVQQIFVVSKILPTEIQKNTLGTSGSSMAIFAKAKAKNESPIMAPNPGISILQAEKPSNPENVVKSFPNFGKTPETILPMPIQQPVVSAMNIQSSSNFMQIIPASGYPPMEILPVSDEAQREFIVGQY